jgi:manganese-transporting P-type ATPase
MACCNTLMNIDGDLIGDPLEKAAFLATGWQLSSGAGGGICRGSFAGTPVSVKQIQKFHFSSELKRMAVIVRVSTARGSETDYVLAKGAPEIVERLLGKCPIGYDRAHRQQAARGGRVIALACKQLNSATLGDLKNMSREEVRSTITLTPYA